MIIKKYKSLNESPVPTAKRDIQWCLKEISYKTQSALSIRYRQDLKFQGSAGVRKVKARHTSKKRMGIEHTRDIGKDCLRLDSNPGLGPLVPISTPKIRVTVPVFPALTRFPGRRILSAKTRTVWGQLGWLVTPLKIRPGCVLCGPGRAWNVVALGKHWKPGSTC